MTAAEYARYYEKAANEGRRLLARVTRDAVRAKAEVARAMARGDYDPAAHDAVQQLHRLKQDTKRSILEHAKLARHWRRKAA